jgi:nitroreductase
MASAPDHRSASTSVPIHPDIAARWSPRVFDPAAELSAEDLTALLEAARWAATWGGKQPVRFLVGRRGDPAFSQLSELLSRGNAYATAAGALILVGVDDGEDDTTARYARVDAGAAMANLSVEAVSRGLIVHPMAGFDVDGARALTEGLTPLAILAVGRLGDYAQAPDDVAERDRRPRNRLPLSDVVLNWPL